MTIQEQINNYLSNQTEPKQSELRVLHSMIMQFSLKCKLWFLDGKVDNGKTVSNPNIG
ncbi:MAG: hypothetical protein WAT89_10195 [Candidatus Kapaibacterium sp.]